MSFGHISSFFCFILTGPKSTKQYGLGSQVQAYETECGHIGDSAPKIQQDLTKTISSAGIWIDTGGKRTNFHCGLCDKVFRQKGNFQRHMLIHSGLKPFVCEQCFKPFRLKQHLMAHVFRIHQSKQSH